MDVVILASIGDGSPPGTPDRNPCDAEGRQALKERNPKILVGQYTILNEAYDDPYKRRIKTSATSSTRASGGC